AGTEQVAGIVGMAKALRLCMECYPTAIKHIQQLNIQLCDGLTRIGGKVNGMNNDKRLCSILNMRFEDNLQSQNLLVELDLAGISVGGSVAYTAGFSSEIGPKILSDDFINIRFSFSRLNNRGEIFRVLSIIDYQLNGNTILEQALTT
ncbi:MAG: aminotransferase class V-fold PLP-dependent enzyme, partial [Chitinophagaceae bacterium]|nr:aminotransferase class V-fold PLP-dependent enzyme [Chitinophagaceae bacterium]